MFLQSPRERVALKVCLGLLYISLGCASRGNIDLLESRLRNQELQLREAERKTVQLKSDLQAARQEQDLLRSQLAKQIPALPEETTQALAAATGLKFHTLLTSGQDRDGITGDDWLHLFLFPHDADGELVKLAGELEVEVFDPSQPGGMTRIGHWYFTAEEARKLWHSGFLSSGFQTEVPLETPPSGSKLILHGRLKTIDGRQFDASHTVSVVSQASDRLERKAIDLVTPPQPLLGQKSPIIPAEFAEENNAPGVRLVPDPYADRPGADPQPIPTDRTPPKETRPVSLPPTAPFPEGLPTSDRWNDETIPAFR